MFNSLVRFYYILFIINFASINCLHVHEDGFTESPLMENIITTTKLTIENYKELREKFLQDEKSKSIGSQIILNNREILANEIIMKVKNDEILKGFKNPSKFLPSRHLFDVLDQIKSSKLFNLIKKMPKGGVLHAHDTALCNTDYLLSLTYRPHLWQCLNNEDNTLKLKFSKLKPDSVQGCQWLLISEERKKPENKNYDEKLRKYFTLNSKHNSVRTYESINDVWSRFKKIFSTVTPMLTYVPVWKDYYKQALKEFYADNVQYLEFRATLPILYDLDGNTFTQKYTLQVYSEALNEFKRENPGFYGSKFIFGPRRGVSNTTFVEYMKSVMELKEYYPNFLAGFDVVGQEDLGRPLIDFANYLLNLPDNINFFFHAGETNWYGTSTDENLIDAVLLGTKRIGHGYAVIKHPMILDAIQKKQIAIEINPISNQILKLNDDNRNHPGSFLFANNFPIVISSDDPSFWETTPLSHDFYIAFLGITSAHSDLRTLKQLAINSIEYSSLNLTEKEIMHYKWNISWNEYIEWVINQSENSTDIY